MKPLLAENMLFNGKKVTKEQKELISLLGYSEDEIVAKYTRLVAEGLAIKNFTQYLKNKVILSELQKNNKLQIIRG